MSDHLVIDVGLQATECDSVWELPLDYVTANSVDMRAIESHSVTCTSCKAKETAVARCSDCASFLCPNCVTAHQFMRCFENHKVNSRGPARFPVLTFGTEASFLWCFILTS